MLCVRAHSCRSYFCQPPDGRGCGFNGVSALQQCCCNCLCETTETRFPTSSEAAPFITVPTNCRRVAATVGSISTPPLLWLPLCSLLSSNTHTHIPKHTHFLHFFCLFFFFYFYFPFTVCGCLLEQGGRLCLR